jgi:Phage Tail Collar Domain
MCSHKGALMTSNLKAFTLGVSLTLASLGLYALAASLPNIFSSGEVISASKMNENFLALKASVDKLEAASARFGTNTSLAANGAGSQCTVGEVILSAGSVANGMPAAGQILNISENEALFTLLGKTYGGDGISTFALPDLRSSAPNGLTYSICMFGVFPALK